MAKPDKAVLKSEGEALKSVIAQARKKTLNFALLQGKDTMYLETHLKKNTAMLRKDAKKKGGGPKVAMGQMNIEGKKIIFSVAEAPPGPFPKLAKKFFMARGLPMQVAFKLPDGTLLEDAEGEAVDAPSDAGTADAPIASTDNGTPVAPVKPDTPSTPPDKAKAKMAKTKKTLKAAASSLKDSSISVAQKEALLRIAVARPEAFKASLKALKAIDKGLNPLDCSPKGLAKAQKAADEEKAKFDLLTDAAKQAKAQFDVAKLAASTASTKAGAASNTASKLLAKLNKIGAAVAK